MARRSLFLAGLLAIGCLLNQGAWGLSGLTAPLPQGVNITVYVQGTVVIYNMHGTPTASSSYENQPPPPEVIYTLTEKPAVADASPGATMRVDFGARAASLVSGDVVQAALTLQLTDEEAMQLGFGVDPFAGGRRRLLSERHEAARRMVLDFHQTDRSLQEVSTLFSLLQALGIGALDQTIKAEEALVIAKNPAKDMFVVNGKAAEFTSLTFVVRSTSCGVQPLYNSDTVRSQWFDNGDNAQFVTTLQRFYSVCSFNQITLKKEKNLVFDVDIPCVGKTPTGTTYNLKTGYGNGKDAFNEMWGLGAVMRAWVQNNTKGINWSDYRRKIIIYPYNWHTYWFSASAVGAMGCPDGDLDCFTWVKPDNDHTRLYLQTIWQELGHNVGLPHSSKLNCNNSRCWRDEYGDFSCPMGNGYPMNPDKDIICYNAPQSYKSGWFSPIAGGHLSAFSGLTPGDRRDFTLPAMATSKSNMLRIVTDASNTDIGTSAATQRALFVSYRVRQPGVGVYDSYLLYDKAVWIHEYNDTANGAPGDLQRPSLLLSILSTDPNAGNKSYVHALPSAMGSLNITLKSNTNTAATVSVCRFLRTVESGVQSCQDGLDNDCDGLVDEDDPDCVGVKPSPVARQPSPSPRQPPRAPPPKPPKRLRAFERQPPPSPRPPPRTPRAPRGPAPPRPPRPPPARK